jgi:hypothetical protein
MPMIELIVRNTSIGLESFGRSSRIFFRVGGIVLLEEILERIYFNSSCVGRCLKMRR